MSDQDRSIWEEGSWTLTQGGSGWGRKKRLHTAPPKIIWVVVIGPMHLFLTAPKVPLKCLKLDSHCPNYIVWSAQGNKMLQHQPWFIFSCSCLFYFLIDLKEREEGKEDKEGRRIERKGGKERRSEKHLSGCLSNTFLMGLNPKPGMCPGLELNPPPFGV